MKRKITFLFLTITLFITNLPAQTPKSSSNASDNDISDTIKLTYIDISARNLSFEAINSYPQQLLKIIRDEDSIKTVRISTFNSYDDEKRKDILKSAIYNPSQKYSSSIMPFLESTHYVNSDSQLTKNIADTLFSGTEKTCMEIIFKALSFSKQVTFDSVLASALDEGKSMTIPSDSVILHKKGTCSEATNIFLALMRHKGIPTRMVVGYCYEPLYKVNGSHAWAECYIEGVGWWAIDPQNAYPSVPSFYYKLFTGKDFEDCRINTLPDMYLRGELQFIAVKVEE